MCGRHRRRWSRPIDRETPGYPIYLPPPSRAGSRSPGSCAISCSRSLTPSPRRRPTKCNKFHDRPTYFFSVKCFFYLAGDLDPIFSRKKKIIDLTRSNQVDEKKNREMIRQFITVLMGVTCFLIMATPLRGSILGVMAQIQKWVVVDGTCLILSIVPLREPVTSESLAYLADKMCSLKHTNRYQRLICIPMTYDDISTWSVRDLEFQTCRTRLRSIFSF